MPCRNIPLDSNTVSCRNTPLDLRELKGSQLIKHFFEGREAALLLECSAEQLDEHDMLAHSQNNLGHYDFVTLGPGTVCIDVFGQLEKGAEWKLVRRIREAKGVVLGRDTGPCGEEKADSGPHKVLEYFGIGRSCRTLRQQLRKGPVVIRSVEVVYDQKNLRAELCQPVQIEVIKRADIRAVHGKGVAEADRRNRAHKVAGIDGVNTGESVGAGGKDGGERCFATCAFAADEEGRRGVVKKSTDLIQLLLAAKKQTRYRRE